MTDDKLQTYLKSVRDNMRVTKVVATRSVKGARGDSFAGFSAAWNSVQDDSGGRGSELIDTMDEDVSPQGMTLHEARIAHLLLAMEADIAATEAAMAGGNISLEDCVNRIKGYKHNYAKLIRQVTKSEGEVDVSAPGRSDD